MSSNAGNDIKKRKNVANDEARALAESANEKHQYFCDFCRKDLSGVVRIRCAECKDFDLCVECFSVGVEVAPHVNNHKYRVMYHVTTPIFDQAWGADEELLLLEAIEQCGFGNWCDIAEHLGSKSTEACEIHYNEVYLSTDSDPPLPAMDRPLIPKKEKIPAAVGTQENYTGSKSAFKQGPSALLGYLPKRKDFDTEWENDAEKAIADMEFKPTDTPKEQELKLEMIRWYNTILDGRAERKEFLFSRNILTREKRRGKDEKDLTNQLQMFARFLPQEEYEKFAEGIKEEMALRREISKLQLYIKNGLRNKEEIEAFEYERKKRAASSSMLAFSNKRRQIKESDGSDMLAQEEKTKLKELGMPVPLYLKLKDELLVEELQNRHLAEQKKQQQSSKRSEDAATSGKQPKKKQKTGGLKLRPSQLLAQIETSKLEALKAFLRSKGVLNHDPQQREALRT
eukprot:CAMPEP_0184482248 /NCGR_PEP_ID=MMETSP0113_2-20130426/3814_1 /TAXON_ID=91329 /ORGANISM="Norrisiella sphaerica, Strain BC52" /LENGTH=455 /DNA_ID=CAMNT_0026861865 /DNA_START=166 /DNA_END=1533 /DNA_ORIENTATION=+